MNLTEKNITCTGCEMPIEGDYIVKEKAGKEEYFHTDCARVRNILHLPVQLRFSGDKHG